MTDAHGRAVTVTSAERIIPLDGRAHLAPAIRHYMGDSRARWQGDTLVIDVTNFHPSTNYRGSGDTLHLIERYTRTGPDAMRYEVTIEDPKVFTRPWKMTMPLYRRQESNAELLEYDCTTYRLEEEWDQKDSLLFGAE